jgi:branched-chain amino acid transport system ATP-binding protein
MRVYYQLLELDKVTKSFGAVTAVDNVSCTVAEGEVLGIMGPNGAGKTTLLNLIMGAAPLDTGSIHFGGERITGLGVSTICHRGIGRTYQIPQPFKHMTVLENLLVGELYGSHHQPMKTARVQARGILERMGLAEKAGSLTSSLGLLELKRLELARALSLHPRLLLLDEIAGGLVESEMEALKGILAGLKRSGQSMVIIEHVLSLLFDLSDRILVLDFGKPIAAGVPADVIHDPEVIKAYLGTERAGTNTPSLPVELMPVEGLSAAGSLPVTEPLVPVEEFSVAASSPLTTEPLNRNESPEKAPGSGAVQTTQLAEMSGDRPVHLRMSHVSAAYGEFQALFDVSLDICEREIVALIGLNGSGKTTLIRALTRQLPLTQGDVVFRGKSIAHERPYHIAELGIAQCIERRKIFPELTVLENLEIGAYCKRAREKRYETLKQVYDLFPILSERRSQLGSTLSGGQQQMLAIGRALMARPELIIFDEISMGLAPMVIDDIYSTIKEINRQGMTTLLVEQSVERSLEVAHRAYVIEHGHIVLSGTAEVLKRDPGFRQVYFGLQDDTNHEKEDFLYGQAGAAAHTHARGPKTGRPTADPEIYEHLTQNGMKHI